MQSDTAALPSDMFKKPVLSSFVLIPAKAIGNYRKLKGYLDYYCFASRVVHRLLTRPGVIANVFTLSPIPGKASGQSVFSLVLAGYGP